MPRLIEPDDRDKKLFDAVTMYAIQYAETEERYDTDIEIAFRRIASELLAMADSLFAANTRTYTEIIADAYLGELIRLGQDITTSYEPIAIAANENLIDLLNRKPQLQEQFDGLFDFLFPDEDDEEEREEILGLTDSDIILLLATLLFANQTLEEQWRFYAIRQRNMLTLRLNQAIAQSLTGVPDAFEDINETMRRSVRQEIRNTLVSKRQGFRTSVETTKRLASVQLNRIKNATISKTVQQNPQFFAAEMWSAILDSSTCLRCAFLDGKIFRLKDGESTLPPIPLHLECRCKPVPVRVGSRLLGKQAKVQTFSGWLTKQSEPVQKRVMGNRKFELFKSGKFRLGDFVTVRRRTPIRIKRNENLG